jgi:Helicase HerA, central domain
MKQKLTTEQKNKIAELLDDGHDRETIAEVVGVTAGQVSAIAAHKTMRARRQPVSLPGEAESSLETCRSASAQASINDILLGWNEKHEALFWNPQRSANPHVLIVGESGFGKTYTTSCLIAELAARSIPSIVFDYGQGFTTEHASADFLRQAKPVQLEAARQGVAISPFEIFGSDVHGPVSVAQRIADTVTRVFQNLGIQQHAIIRQAVIEVLEEAGIHAKVSSSWNRPLPRFGLLHKKLIEYADDFSNSDRKTPRTAASHISSLFVFDIFRSTGSSIRWADILQAGRNATVIQLRGLEQNLQRATTEFLLWNFLAFLESAGPSLLKCFVVIDEAHRMPSDEGSAIDRLLREGRKFGAGAILASQQPEDFTAVAFSNTATKLVFQISDDNSSVAKQLHRKLKTPIPFLQIHKTITTLDRGRAFALTNNAGNVIKVDESTMEGC